MKYLIPKGFHFSIPPLPIFHFNVKKVKYYIKFDRNCWYKREDVIYTGINKLCGLGFGLNHHIDSVRIGWQPDFDNENKINLYSYWYDESDNKEYQKYPLGEVCTDTGFEISIKIDNDEYEVMVFGQKFYIDNEIPDKKWGLWLRPYFGGKSRSPKTMKIWISKNVIK